MRRSLSAKAVLFVNGLLFSMHGQCSPLFKTVLVSGMQAVLNLFKYLFKVFINEPKEIRCFL